MPAEGAARPAQDRDRIDRAIHHASWLGALAMFAYDAALSFDVLHTIALAAGLSPILAWLWPLGFETFMAVAAVAVLAEQRTRPGRTPWYPWVLTALAAGSSIALNFGHPYIPLDPPPRLLVACVYGVPPVCAPFAWHLFLLRVAHRRRQHLGQDSGAGDHPGTPSSCPWSSQHPNQPTPGRYASRPAPPRTGGGRGRWCAACWPTSPRTPWCAGRTSRPGPGCRAAAPTRCCARNAPAWPPATATSPPGNSRGRDQGRHLVRPPRTPPGLPRGLSWGSACCRSLGERGNGGAGGGVLPRLGCRPARPRLVVQVGRVRPPTSIALDAATAGRGPPPVPGLGDALSVRAVMSVSRNTRSCRSTAAAPG